MSGFKCSDQVELGEEGAIVRIPDLIQELEHVVYAQCQSPLSNSHPAFRIKVVQLAKDAVVAVGISLSPDLDSEDIEDEEKDSERKPDAIAYFSDKGTVASPARGGSGHQLSTYGAGDAVMYVIEQLTERKSLVSILKNGVIQCRQWVTVKAKDLLPTVNVWWGSAELHVEWLTSSAPSFSMTNLDDWLMSDGITVQDGHISVSSDKPCATQSPLPFQSGTSMYFEMTLVSLGDNEEDGPLLAITTATSDGRDRPGEGTGDISYNGAAGKIVKDGQAVKGKNLGEGGKCKAGDVIGCGIAIVEANKQHTDSQKVVVYFTKNREVVHNCNTDQSLGGFYPMASFFSRGSCVKLDVTVSPPELPDLDKWVATAKRALEFPGLGSFEVGVIPTPSSKHEEGVTEGIFRFSEPIGCPTSDTIRPQSKLKDGKLLQLLKTITPSEPFFTVKIVDKVAGDDSAICIGVSRDGQSCGSIPGALVDSVGYSSRGKILLGGRGSFKTESYENGDVIGVYVEFVDLTKVVQFIKNGRLVGQSVIQGSNKDIFPSLGFYGAPATVQVTWPQSRPSIPPTFSKDNFDNWLKSGNLLLNGRQLAVEKKTRKLSGRVLISPQPLSQAWTYYEVQINCSHLSTQDKKVLKAPAVGLTNQMSFYAYKDMKKQKDVRDIRYFCHTNSVGYVDYLQNEMLPLNQCIRSGDRLGWGIIYPSMKNIPSDLARQVVIVYCCLNGDVIYHKPMEQPSGGLFPVVTLYRYGEVAEMLINQRPPSFANISSWIDEADAFRIEVDKQRKAAGLHKQTAEERRARPASPAERPENHLKKYTIYIHYDSDRYNEATHIQARLDAKGFLTSLTPQASLNTSRVASEITSRVADCHAVVCCMGPEISDTRTMPYVLQAAQERGKPVLPFILEKLKWPPEGALQHEWQKLVMHKIETSGDFDWAIEQIEEKTLSLKGKGYNGKEIRVGEGKGATMLYSDAQKGNQTTNMKSDPDALKKAIKDADERNANSFGSDNAAGAKGISKSLGSLRDPMPRNFEDREPRRYMGKNQSRACVIL